MGGGSSKPKIPSNIKLTYFNIRGRAELIRLIFALSGIKYEDVRIESSQWGDLKPKTPWGGLPLLEVDGCVMGQSISIARYAAVLGGIAGKTPMERALADSLVDTCIDLITPMIKTFLESDEEKKAALMEEFKTKTLPSTLTNMEKFLSSNNGGNGYFVGNSATWADLAFFGTADSLMKQGDVFGDFPKLAGLYKRVSQLPKLKEYLENRPDSPI